MGKTILQAERVEVVVNGRPGLERLLRQGKYGWLNPEVRRLPIEGNGKSVTNLALVCLGDGAVEDPAPEEEVCRLLDKYGFCPAGAVELLSLGIHHPDKQREFPIFALDAALRFRDDRLVAYLGMNGPRSARRRCLHFYWAQLGFPRFCRFLAKPKSKAGVA